MYPPARLRFAALMSYPPARLRFAALMSYPPARLRFAALFVYGWTMLTSAITFDPLLRHQFSTLVVPAGVMVPPRPA